MVYSEPVGLGVEVFDLISNFQHFRLVFVHREDLCLGIASFIRTTGTFQGYEHEIFQVGNVLTHSIVATTLLVSAVRPEKSLRPATRERVRLHRYPALLVVHKSMSTNHLSLVRLDMIVLGGDD